MAITNDTAMKILVQVSFRVNVSIFLYIYLGVKLLVHMGTLYLNFRGPVTNYEECFTYVIHQIFTMNLPRRNQPLFGDEKTGSKI